MVANAESVMYLNAPSRSRVLLYMPIMTKLAIPVTSIKTYKEKRSRTMSMPFMPSIMTINRFVNELRWSSMVVNAVMVEARVTMPTQPSRKSVTRSTRK